MLTICTAMLTMTKNVDMLCSFRSCLVYLQTGRSFLVSKFKLRYKRNNIINARSCIFDRFSNFLNMFSVDFRYKHSIYFNSNSGSS